MKTSGPKLTITAQMGTPPPWASDPAERLLDAAEKDGALKPLEEALKAEGADISPKDCMRYAQYDHRTKGRSPEYLVKLINEDPSLIGAIIAEMEKHNEYDPDDDPYDPDAALPVLMSEPPDLLPIREAARLTGRPLAAVRRRIAEGELKAHYGPGTHPNNRPVLVSRSALLALPDDIKRAPPERPPPAESVEMRAIRAALSEARVELTAVRETAEALRLVARVQEDRVRELDLALAAERTRGADLSAELAGLRMVPRVQEDSTRDLALALVSERARAADLSTELAALRSDTAMSWFQRWLGFGTQKLPTGDR